jgi:hypothetical protein
MFYLDIAIPVVVITGFVCLYVWIKIKLCKTIYPGKEEKCT